MKTLLTAMLCSVALCLSSCTKDEKPQPENALTGDWRETELNGTVRSLRFTANHSFTFSVGSTDGSGTIYNGTYLAKGDSLKVTVAQLLVQEPGKPVQTTPSTDRIYEKATFSIKADTLTLKYITYPADAPVPTTAKFKRMMKID